MASFCRVVFWFSVLTIGYAYVGYPIVISILTRIAPRPVHQAEVTPTVTLVIPAFNEETCIAEKIESSLALDYPPDKREVVVVADGSHDATVDIVARYVDRGVRLLYQPERRGKAAAMNRAVSLTHGEIVVFSDANAFFQPDTLRKLVRNFADPQVGCVAGRKAIRGMAGEGEGLYWRYESYLKRCDSMVGSVMGAAGEITAIRRELYTRLEEDSIIEDFILSLRIVERGWRSVYEPEAVAWEEGLLSVQGDWIRRTRIAAGGFQAFSRLRGLLDPRHGMVTFQYFSHRMLRWIVTPGLWVLMFFSNLGLLGRPFFDCTMALQVLFFGLALAGYAATRRGWRIWWLQMPFYVCLLNAAALVGGYRYLTGRQSVLWHKARS